MNLSKDGENLIKTCEGLVLSVYQDCGLKTIGWGHTLKRGEEKITKITLQDAEDFFQKDVKEIEKNLSLIIPKASIVLSHQKKYDALISLIYNIGIKSFSDSNIYKFLKKEIYKGSLYWWSKWIRDSKGEILPGLVNRRKKEIYMFDEEHLYLTHEEKQQLFI